MGTGWSVTPLSLHAVPELSTVEVLPALRREIGVEDGARAECAACGFRAYANPKPTACAVFADDDGRVLLARRADEPSKGKWDLPGGFLDEGEHPLDALRRELREETGLEVEPGEFLGIWMDRYGDDEDAHATLNLYWAARVLGGEPRGGRRRLRARVVSPGRASARASRSRSTSPTC